jgi:hypothetical protein
MRSWISLGVLFGAVLALGAWIHFKPPARELGTHALSALKPAEVKRARLERFDGEKTRTDADRAQASAPAAAQHPAIVLERKDAEWRLTAPFAARADGFQVGRLLTILESRSAVRYPASDLARFDLDRPLARLTIEDQGFAYGALNTTTREQYVLTAEYVYVVPVSYGAALPRDAEALVARALFGAAETATRFELPDFSIALEDGTWRVQPAASEAGADERLAWVDAWQHAMAIRATRHDGSKPAAQIRVTLKNGGVLTLGILQREPEVVLVRTDEGIQYHFFAASAKRLLSPPGSRGAERINK